ncbi:MAG: T9SS type A sorting domain-containing protein [Chitinophagales bacterium]
MKIISINTIEEKHKNKTVAFSVSPNPALENLQIKFNEIADYELELYNVIGEKIFETSVENKNNFILKNDYKNGIYFFKCK